SSKRVTCLRKSTRLPPFSATVSGVGPNSARAGAADASNESVSAGRRSKSFLIPGRSNFVFMSGPRLRHGHGATSSRSRPIVAHGSSLYLTARRKEVVPPSPSFAGAALTRSLHHSKDRRVLSMNLKLADKTALVSGSTKGIGFAIAAGLAREGARVIVNGRTDKAVVEAKERIDQTVPAARIESFAGDLSTGAATETLLRRFPLVDILVNNLGIFEPKPFEDIPDEDWRRFFEVNVLSGVRLSRGYLPGMRQRNWGRIVFISSESAINTPAEMIHYGMTKTAQLAVSRGLAQLCAGTGVTVNAVLPGPTHSAGVEEFAGQLSGGKPFAEFEKAFFMTIRPSSLLKRFAMTEEVANLVTYVCSPLSAATNGAALRVDGGVVQACF